MTLRMGNTPRENPRLFSPYTLSRLWKRRFTPLLTLVYENRGNADRLPREEGVEALVRSSTCIRVSTALTPSARGPVCGVPEEDMPPCVASGNYRRERSGTEGPSQIQFRHVCKSPVCLTQRPEVNASRGFPFYASRGRRTRE